MKTVLEYVGGHADGVQCDVPDENEPDDVPDSSTIVNRTTGERARYCRRERNGRFVGPVICLGKDGKGQRVYYYDLETD